MADEIPPPPPGFEYNSRGEAQRNAPAITITAPPNFAPPASGGAEIPPPPPGFTASAPPRSPTAGGAGYTGQILPFRTDAQGKSYFDIHAGLPGRLIDAVSLPGQVASG